MKVSIGAGTRRMNGRQTDRLGDADVVNLCLARPATAPGPLKPVPPNILKYDGGAIPGNRWVEVQMNTVVSAVSLHFLRQELSAGRPECHPSQPVNAVYKQAGYMCTIIS